MKFSCPNCSQHLAGDESLIGATIECPVCGTSFQVSAEPDSDHAPIPESTPEEAEGNPKHIPNDAGHSDEEKPTMDQWLAQTGKLTGQASVRLGRKAGKAGIRFGGKAWRSLLRFLRFETAMETDVSDFDGDSAKAFELQRLVPLAVCCLVFGWGVSWLCSALEWQIDAGFRLQILPIGALALYGAIRGIRHFLRPKKSQWMPWIAVCLFTATMGLFTLMASQSIADYAASHTVRARGPAAFFVFVAKIVGWSYQAVYNPDASPLAKFLGYVFGVGFCEEAVKLLPLFLLVKFRKNLPFKLDLSFRSVLMLGFFSGLGFGIGEALSAQYGLIEIPRYPGAMPTQAQYVSWLGGIRIPNTEAFHVAIIRWRIAMDAYNNAIQHAQLGGQITRWFACVPSHAIYTVVDAACFWMLYNRIAEEADVKAKFLWYVACVGAVAVLHGIYDMLCGIPYLGLVLDAASLVLLWWMVRLASKSKNAAGDASSTGFEDMDTRTVSTLGKSFAKTYLILLAGIGLYAAIFC